MEVNKLLPIGSVALIKGGKKKIMIIGVKQRNKKKDELFDYLAIPYPEGFMAPELTFFVNHDNLEEVYFRGYETEERDVFLENLDKYYKDKEKNNE